MKYTIITGATSGIGKELAFIYANKGHHLILISRRLEVLTRLKNEIEASFSVSVECLSCDLTDIEKVRSTFSHINQHYDIHCLINNAGIGLFEPIEHLTIETVNEQTNINFIAPVLSISLLLENIKRNQGSIINLCSVLSYLPNRQSSIYVATKHALLGFSNTIRLENPQLHVLTVHPITVRTNFFNDEAYFKKIKKVLEPNVVAKKIYIAHQKRKRKLNCPKSISILGLLYYLFPSVIDYFNYKFFSNK